MSSKGASTSKAWDEFWTRVTSEDLLTAKALIDLSPALQTEADSWVQRHGDEGLVDWVRDVDVHGRSLSSSESRLFRVVAALVDPSPDAEAGGVPFSIATGSHEARRAVPLVYFLELMGSWEGEVWRILTTWGTGGNNRDVPGRFTLVPSRHQGAEG